MAAEYTGLVTLDDTTSPLHNVLIDDLDSPDWRASWRHASEGGAIPLRGATLRVVLRTGTRAGEIADARFGAEMDWWLEGFTPFAPAG